MDTPWSTSSVQLQNSEQNLSDEPTFELTEKYVQCAIDYEKQMNKKDWQILLRKCYASALVKNCLSM